MQKSDNFAKFKGHKKAPDDIKASGVFVYGRRSWGLLVEVSDVSLQTRVAVGSSSEGRHPTSNT